MPYEGLPNNATSVPPIDGKVATAGTLAFGTGVTGDAQDRWEVQGDGSWWLGPGTGARTKVAQYLSAGSPLYFPARITVASIDSSGSAGSVLRTNGTESPWIASSVSAGVTPFAVQWGTAPATVDAFRVLVAAGGTPIWSIDKGGRPVAGQSAPTPSALSASTAVSVSANAHDEACIVNFTTAAGIAADASVVRLTFATAFANAPLVVITPLNADSANALAFVTNVGTGAADIALHAPPALAKAMSFAVRVVGV